VEELSLQVSFGDPGSDVGILEAGGSASARQPSGHAVITATGLIPFRISAHSLLADMMPTETAVSALTCGTPPSV
jgi:hypothetical protein